RLDRPEDTGEDAVLHGTLQERVAGDVYEDVADADQREREHGDGDVWPESDQEERSAPEHDADEERHRQATPAGEVDRSDRPDHSADADGGVEPPDPGIAGLEHLDRDDDEQDGERAG